MAGVVLFLVTMFAGFERARAAVGEIDTTFNSGGFGITSTNHVAKVLAIAVQSDGKILIGGEFNRYNGINCPRGIVWLNSDGTRDPSFNLYGRGVNGSVSAIAVQSDGKILIAGDFSEYNRNNPDVPNGIIRLNEDGFPDATFNEGRAGVDLGHGSVSAIVLQPKGKVLIIGSFDMYNGTAVRRVARLNSSGTLDTSFLFRLNQNADVRAIAPLPNGKFLIGGRFNTYNSDVVVSNNIAQLNADGTVDTTFNYLPPNGAPGATTGGTSGVVDRIFVQPDGKIIVGGSFTHYNDDPAAPDRFARLNANGTLDTTFNSNGAGPSSNTSPFIHTVNVQSDGKILIGGWFLSYNEPSMPQKIARLNADGTLDTTFNPGGAGGGAGVGGIYAIVVQSDGKILIGGNISRYNGSDNVNRGIMRLASN
jgi:uncharacterized delta-60 repeat protein